MLNNVELFNECLEHKVKNIDKTAHRLLNKEIIPIDKSTYSELLVKNSELIELIQKYNNLNVSGDTTQNKKIIESIDKCLSYEGMNMSPFSQYLMVHDLTYDMYLDDLSQEEKEYIIKSYIRDRHQMYINHDYSDIIFQVLSDSYSHKRKGVIGVEKIKKACEKNDINHFNNNYEENYYLLPDNGDKELFNDSLKHFHIDYAFASEKQNKLPDAFIRYNDCYIIVEHKKMKSTGGGQNKQLSEIVDFIKAKERNVYYVSYLDGVLFNELLDPPKTRKIYTIKQDILQILEKNEFNYFVNEYGFDKLIDYIVKNN